MRGKILALIGGIFLLMGLCIAGTASAASRTVLAELFTSTT
jgi:hypothetical protein